MNTLPVAFNDFFWVSVERKHTMASLVIFWRSYRKLYADIYEFIWEFKQGIYLGWLEKRLRKIDVKRKNSTSLLRNLPAEHNIYNQETKHTQYSCKHKKPNIYSNFCFVNKLRSFMNHPFNVVNMNRTQKFHYLFDIYK